MGSESGERLEVVASVMYRVSLDGHRKTKLGEEKG